MVVSEMIARFGKLDADDVVDDAIDGLGFLEIMPLGM